MTREDAIANLKVDIKYWENTSVSTEHYYMAIEALEQESKTGHWIDVPVGRYMLLHRCSNCLQNSEMESNYCPNCGAKMNSEK